MQIQDVAQSVGHSGREAVYVLPDNELSAGSTLGGPKAMTILKASGALEKVWSVDAGVQVFGALVLRHYDRRTGVILAPRETGRFVIHPEHQEHYYDLMNGVGVHEDVFVLSSKPEHGDEADPPAVYYSVRLRNDSDEPATLATYAFCDLRGDTGHDVTARWHASRHALFVWNASNKDLVRVFACSEKPDSYETTLDAGMAVSPRCPGRLSNNTTASGSPLGVMRLSFDLKPGEVKTFYFLLTFSSKGRDAADTTLATCPAADDALTATRDYYQSVLGQCIVLTPDQHINRGVMWAKANMLRIQQKAPTGWCFVNDPTRSNNSVGRDTAWYAFGADYLTPDFARESLMAYVKNQEKNGKIVEYYDVRTGHTEDYGLNINDDTPLIILALWHHVKTTGDVDFLREVYPAAAKAADYILSQRKDGLVWCTADGVGNWGIASWRNVIPNYQLSGAVTEVNAECYAALHTAANMARVLEKHDESKRFAKAAEDLKAVMRKRLYDPENGLYYLCIGLDGHPRSDVSCDLVFPVMFNVADDRVASHIVGRLSASDFWTASGMRSVPRDAPDYSPNAGAGLLGGVWVGVAFWYAFAAARYTPEFMANALSTSFRNYSTDPRAKNTVPGQFSEWLHGETLVNQGMMLSPWFPPRYIWAAIEGVAGLDTGGGTLDIQPNLAPQWKWMAVMNLPVRGESITFFAIRMPAVALYTNTPLQRAVNARSFEEDISDRLEADGPDVTAIGLRQGSDLMVLVGSTGDQAVSTSLRVRSDLRGEYELRLFDSLFGRWEDSRRIAAAHLQTGVTLQIERKGFALLDLRQVV